MEAVTPTGRVTDEPLRADGRRGFGSRHFFAFDWRLVQSILDLVETRDGAGLVLMKNPSFASPDIRGTLAAMFNGAPRWRQ
jgi:hypothetical protein